MDGYMNLANAIVKQAADDYFQLLAGIMPIPIPPSCNLTEIERFFHSDWYDLLCKIDPGYLMRKLKEKAEKMKLEYVVAKERGSNRYYVHRVGGTVQGCSRKLWGQEAGLASGGEVAGT